MNRKQRKIAGWVAVPVLVLLLQPLSSRVSRDRLVLGINPAHPVDTHPRPE